jgi:hypothetical protein
MTPTTYDGWVADGEPWHPAPCITALKNLMERYGYTVYTIGDTSHLQAALPEDHTPFSHTPWPGTQPYPAVLAMDVMPGGRVDWRELGARIVRDRGANVPGTEWIKYVNWTDTDGSCLHSSWEPNYEETASSDTGHIHISARTDRYTENNLLGWDPVAAVLGGAPTPTPPAAAGGTSNWTETIVNNLPLLQRGATGQPVKNLQGLLDAQGANPKLAVDGDFGPLTDSALRSFQANRHVANSVRQDGSGDGQCGQHTWAALLGVA